MGQSMGEYRFFKVNPGGMIDSGTRERLPDDEAAIARGRLLVDSSGVEVWAGGRRIAKLPPQRMSA